MSRKRYFFVHLAIFAAVCGSLAIAGVSSYQDFESERQTVAESRAKAENAGPDQAAPAPEVPVLALSGD